MKSTSADTKVLTVRRTTTFLASLLVALCSGTSYVYSVYGPQLGHRLQLSYANQNLVGMSIHYGSSTLGPILGKLADSRGPRPSLALSFVLLLSGYLGMKAVYDSWEGNTKPAGGGTLFTLILCAALFGIGSEAGFCAALNVVMKSFPDRIRSTATGSVISGLGLSAFVFSTIARTIFPDNTSDFLLVLALGTPIPMVLGWFLIRICPYPEHTSRAISDDDESDLGEFGDLGLVPIHTHPEHTTQETSENEDLEESSDPSETSQFILKSGERTQPPNISGLTMLRTLDFWILFWIVSLLAGSGIMWINNVGLMVRALLLQDAAAPDEKENAKWQTFQVSVLSVANCIGRVLIGVIADFAKHRGVRRVQCLSLVATSFFISQLVGLCVRDINQLQYAVIFVGISYGATFGLMPIIIIRWFGIAHVSENCAVVYLSFLVMGNIFPLMFGGIFDAHSTPTEHGMRCLEGARCYSSSLYVTAFACVCAFILTRVAAKRDLRYNVDMT